MTKAAALALSLSVAFPDVEAFMGDDLTDALNWKRTQSFTLSSDLPCGEAMCWAVVLPEVARHSGFRDFFETSALELLYVDCGAGCADFSIGPFQMKPSFAQKVEAWFYPVAPEDAEEPAHREARLQRLRSVESQWVYLAHFVRVVHERFPVIETMCDTDRVRFMASAYNGGFLRTYADIEDAQWQSSYPYGVGYEGDQLRYADVAEWCYRQLVPVYE